MVRKKKSRYLPIVIVGLSITGLGVGAFALVRGFLNSTPVPPKKLVAEIKVIRPPPPPPDLPPPPPPPPEEKVDVVAPEKNPDPTPSDEPPPGDQLGLDAAGSAGGDAFGLLARAGGRDLLASGGSATAWYTGVVKDEILQHLMNAEQKARKGEYSVTVRLWIRDDGSIERVRITQSSGNRERDQMIESALMRMARVSRSPPAEVPQPISLRIVARG